MGRDSYASRIGGIAKGLKRMRHISKLRTGAIAWLIAIASVCVQFFVPVPAVADFDYDAVSGDTYWDIAVKFDVSLTELLEINGLSENDVLSIGKDLTIPSEFDFDYTQVIEHRVKAGECLSVIADKYGVSAADVARFNGLDANNTIYIDQVLTIPPQGKCPIAEEAEDEYYIVRPGDSAWLIARQHDVSVGALLAYNGLTENSIITVGQRLKMPPSSQAPPERELKLETYTIRPNDCLSIIADKHDCTVAKLCEINGISIDEYLHPGQRLKVPARPDSSTVNKPAQKRAPMVVTPDVEEYDGQPLPPMTPPPANSPLGEAMRDESVSVFDFTSRQDNFSISGYYDGTHTFYRIEPGDVVSYIADCFEVTVDDICEASNLTDADYIITGQIIKLPGKHDVSTLHEYKEEYISTGGKAFLDTCLEYLDLPYDYGGQNLSRSVDCSGLIWAIVKRDHGISLPRSAKTLSQTDYGILIEYDALQEGDMVFFHTTRPGISHVGIYAGNGKFVHASSAKGKVCIGHMDSGYYKERFIKALRLNFL